MVLRLIALLCSSALAAGCGAPESGTVIDRKHEPPGTDLVFIPITTGQSCSSTGKSTVCTPITTMIPFNVYDDEDWRLRLRDGDNEGWVRVSEHDYDAHPTGSYFDGSAVQEHNRKERAR